MKTVLVNTVANFLGPPQGPARLYGYLRRAGVDITFLNLNHDIYSYFLSPTTLQRLWRNVSPQMRVVDRFYRNAVGSLLLASSKGEIAFALADSLLGKGSAETYDARVRVDRDPLPDSLARQLSPDRLPLVLNELLEEVTRRIGSASEKMDRLFLRQDSADFLAQFRILLCGKAMVDTLHYPAMLDFGLGFQGSEWSLGAADLLRATSDSRHNWLLPYFQWWVVPQILRLQPKLLGLSATHYSELIPVLTLASLVREQAPDIHITIGGAVLSYIGTRLAKNPELWKLIDSAVSGPGEIPFLELTNALESNQSLSRVPNLLYKQGNNVVLSERQAFPRAEELTTPEYVNLRPGAILGLETSNQCSWSRCAFCVYAQQDHDTAHDPKTFTRTDSQMVDDLARLGDQHDPSLVWLTDHSVSPDRLLVLAEAGQRRDSVIPFAAFVRLDPAFESADLCKKLAAGGFLGGQAGLEAGSERINRLINKGVEVARAPAVLQCFRDQDILIHLYTVVGFPGETEQEAWATYEFLRNHRSLLSLDWHVFWLGVVENTPLTRTPERFGLTLQVPPAEALVPYCGYEVREGLSLERARELVIQFEDRLSDLRHPVSQWMDNELYKLFLLKEKADARRSQRHRRLSESD